MLAHTGAVALEQRDEGVGGRLRARVERRLRVADGNGRAVAVTLQAGKAARGLNREVGRRRVCQRPVLPPRRHRYIDERGVEDAHVVVPEPESVEVARRRGLDQHVGARDEPAQRVAVTVGGDIERDAAFAERDRGPVQRAVRRVILAVRERGAPAAGVAAGRLDPDDLGAEVGEHAPGEHGELGREVDDADACEGAGDLGRGVRHPISPAVRSPASKSSNISA